MATVEGLLYP